MRELTARQHAQIRWQLVLIPAYVWLVYGWCTLFIQLPVGFAQREEEFMRDFATFYAQGVIGKERNHHALYDADAQARVLQRVVPGKPEVKYPPIHGPQVAMLFAPLAWLSYGPALWTWLFITFVVYGVCCYALYRACPMLREKRWSLFWLVLAFPGLRFDAAFGQTAAIGLLCVTAGFLAFRDHRPFLAGFAIGSLFYKPQLGLVAAFVFLLAREWRVVFGATAAVFAQLASAALYWGPGIFPEYVRNLLTLPTVAAQMEPIKFHMHSWRAFFDLLQLPAPVSLVAYVLAALVTATAALICWRARGPLALRYSALIVATVLVNPHMWVYDFLILTPVFMLLWNWVLDRDDQTIGELLPLRSTIFQLLLYFCYMSPVFGVTADITRIQLSVIALSLLLAIVLVVLKMGVRPIRLCGTTDVRIA